MVPHTHWDREWYLPFEQFRVPLARTMDDLLDVLEQHDGFVFTLDGQAVILEDYLEVRPEQAPRLRRLVASGRLAIGPSYVLPDEFLSGPEALLRNLMMGRQVCLRHGGPPMAVAYAPDTFGHIAQLPQILRGFGIDSFVFWRGLGDEIERLGGVFQWGAPDGSQVLAIRLLEGYANARDLGRWTRRDGWVRDDPSIRPEVAARRVAEFLERWRETLERSGQRDVLLGNGVDHEPIQRDLLEMLAACEARLPDASFRVATLESYVDALRWRLTDLKSHSGELAGGRECCVVRSVNSTRMYLKQANEQAERALFVAETLATLAYLGGHGDAGTRGRAEGPQDPALRTQDSPAPSTHHSSLVYPYPLRELRLAWRELLRNHPHDSLPGCSLDEVHLDMEQRFRTVQQIARQVQREALATLAGAKASLRYWEDPLERRSLVNVLPWARTGLVELDLPPELRSRRNLVAETPQGPLPVQTRGSASDRRALIVAEVPGFGARQVRLSSGSARPSHSTVQAVGSHAIQNEFYRVEVAPNGTLRATDLRTGATAERLHSFEDVADRGDEYSFCPVEGDAPWDSSLVTASTRVLASGPAVAELEIRLVARLPRSLRRDRKARARATASCPVRTVVRLAAGIDRIEFRTTVVNRARDHRLRVVFPAPDSSQEIRAEGHFAVLRRPARPVWNGLWREPPTVTHHTLGMVAAGKLALMSRGLPEYEAVPNAEGGVDLTLTLLRCVGWLSWSDLATRPGAEDPHVPTPGAQCPGAHTFEYALSLRGKAGDAELVRAAQDYRVGLVAGPRGADPGGSPHIEGEEFAFSALKGAEDGKGAILRLNNPGLVPAEARVSAPGLTVRRCRLDETGPEPEAVDVALLRPGEIATYRLEY